MTKTTYDHDGRTIKVTLPDGAFVETGYDTYGRKQWSMSSVNYFSLFSDN